MGNYGGETAEFEDAKSTYAGNLAKMNKQVELGIRFNEMGARRDDWIAGKIWQEIEKYAIVMI